MTVNEGSSRPGRARMLALVIAGVLIGAVLVPPVGAHVAGWAHNWKKHIRPKTDNRYFTKSQANSRFVRGFEPVAENTLSNSDPFKTLTVGCPNGKVPVGGGARIFGTLTQVALVQNHPEDDGTWVAGAIEVGAGNPNNWGLRVVVNCAFAGS